MIINKPNKKNNHDNLKKKNFLNKKNNIVQLLANLL
jgi:hypothetical protein